ncbi:MAG: hypothetical protein LBR93_10435, partial [Treponema sp.]|nr:hypothetical protein [Treponema sp.]
MGDLAGLVAPRPLVVVSGREDPIFPQHGVQKAFKEARIITTNGNGDKSRQSPIDWHAAFRDGIRLTFYPYRDVLSFEFEHPLNTEPLRIDAVIIKKEPGVVIDNPIGA